MPTNIHVAIQAPIQAGSGVLRDDASTYRTARLNYGIPDALLAEVDFKWLLSGRLGRWRVLVTGWLDSLRTSSSP